MWTCAGNGARSGNGQMPSWKHHENQAVIASTRVKRLLDNCWVRKPADQTSVRLPVGETPMPEEIDHHRRRFLGAAATTIAAAQLALSGSARSQPGKAKPASGPTGRPGTNTSFGPLKQIDAGVLNVGYAEAGPSDGPAVILLHGWP